MDARESTTSATDVPGQIFDAFVNRLRATDIPVDTIERLASLLKEREFSDKSLRAALFPESDHDQS